MTDVKQSLPNMYWATETDHKALLDNFDRKIRDYFDDLRNTGLLAVYERAYRAYYGGRVSANASTNPLFESSRLSPGGKQGEKTRLKANHYRNLVKHLVQLATQQKPDAQARASNSDYESEAQTVLANGLIDYYWREKDLSRYIKDGVEMMVAVYGEMFIHGPWDPNTGEVYTVNPDGTPVYEGDQNYEVISPMSVIRNPTMRAALDQTWKIIKTQHNKWDLASKYKGSGLENDILNTTAFDPQDTLIPVFQLRGGKETKDDDIVEVFTFYHTQTDALPQGRMVVFLRDLVLFDGPLPYQDIPVFRICAENIQDTIYGYSIAWDILSLQEGIDELHTSLMSNNKTYSQQSIWIKTGDSIQVSQLSGGAKVFKSDEMPQPVQLTKSAPESYQYLNLLEHTAEQLTGISSTVRGNPESNLKSGNALALVVSQSIQFASSIDEAVNRVVEDVSMGLIENLRDFSKTDRVANIVGDSNRSYLETFHAPTDLSEISRVVCEQVNPLSKTIAGRSEIANNLLQQGLIKDGQEYMLVLETGRLDPVMSKPRSQMLRIKSENEQMRKGVAVPALLTDDHALDIREHSSILDSPDSRKNPQIVQLVLDHIQQHIQLATQLQMTNPGLAMILGQTPMPMPPPPPPQGSQPGNPVKPVQQQADKTQATRMPSLPPGTPPEVSQAYEHTQPPPGVLPPK